MFTNCNITVYISIKYVSTNIKYRHKIQIIKKVLSTNIKYRHKIQIIKKVLSTNIKYRHKIQIIKNVLLYFILIYTGIYVLNGFECFKCAVKTLNGQLVTSVPG